MWHSPLAMLSKSILISSFLGLCNGLPQAATSTEPTPTPSAAVIPWTSKIDALRSYILEQPDQNATKGFWYGPGIQKNFTDGQCLQVRFYNWDCFHDIPYKMRGVVEWLDISGVRDIAGISDPFRYYTYGYYVDPDDGWTFYNEARLSFGACGNRGPQSSCGVGWCVDESGTFPGSEAVPEGQSPYVDPNNRDNLCPWLRSNGAAAS
ncbi:hypothetical protein BKA66DRAFT_89021 [Pyrenochaeta sp. MPI-SDFR-AT-0127]|nr:hypothetical protein BKA66DRAFT_89021 [Pyrenochaeta sp. MPI-SDFR-AT-0127]